MHWTGQGTNKAIPGLCMDTGQGRALIRLYPLYGYWAGQGTDKGYTLCMDTGQGRALIRLYPLYGYLTGQSIDKAIPSVWVLDRAEG